MRVYIANPCVIYSGFAGKRRTKFCPSNCFSNFYDKQFYKFIRQNYRRKQGK